MKVLHEERQPLLPPIAKVVVSLISLGMLLMIVMGQENSEYPWWLYLIIFIVLLLANLLVWMNVLHLKITSHDIRYRFPPLMNSWHVIPREQIKGYQVGVYNWFKFGGWGYRWNLAKGGWAFTTIFNKHVVEVERNSKKPVSIGTFKPEDVKTAMEKMLTRPTYE